METLWFTLVALMLTLYVVFDGFDLGAGIVHLLVARTPAERRAILATIGPVWDGNEVWLLAAGGSLYCAFPLLYASGLSGFYLPLMIVLWLLILRGIAIEFRNHLAGPVWVPFWDAVFAGASTLLALTFGAALGNVVRGVPLDRSGYFFVPLWTDFRVGPEPGVLDWYTVLVGLGAVAALGLHGALWVAMKAPLELAARARRLAARALWAAAAFTILVTMATFRVQPQISASLAANPAGFVFPALALSGLVAAAIYLRRAADALAFLSSTAYLTGMLGSVFAGVHPLVLPASGDPAFALTIYNTATGDYGLRVGLVWWSIGMALVTAYFIFTYRHFAGRLPLGDEA
jgi:cytochrome d ubiquinol oxidase subunit II